MAADPKRRVALYARVSTAGGGQDVELQLEELRTVALERGWRVVDEYVDDGVSGSARKRPALDRLLADAGKRRLDVVVVWRLDRLGRSLSHLLQLLEQLGRLGVDLVSLRDTGIDTTSASGRLLFHMLGAFAEFERELIRERVIAGVRRAQAAGKHCGRPRVGFDPRPAEALLERGHSVREVARMLQMSEATLRRRLAERRSSDAP